MNSKIELVNKVTNETTEAKDRDRVSLTKFVKIYSQIPKSNKNERARRLESIMEIRYAPYIQKLVLIETILNACTMTDEETNLPYIDNNSYYISLWMGMISLYTKLATSENEYDTYQAYDLLKSCGLLEDIMALIGEAELTEITNMSKNACDTFLARNCTPAVILHKDFNRTLTAIEKPITKIVDSAIDTMDKKPEKLVNIINSIIEKIKK